MVGQKKENLIGRPDPGRLGDPVLVDFPFNVLLHLDDYFLIYFYLFGPSSSDHFDLPQIELQPNRSASVRD